MAAISLIALDLDDTITAPRSQIEKENSAFIERLAEKYRVVIIGAGHYERILAQTNSLGVDVVGNYGMQFAEYRRELGKHILVKDEVFPVDCADIARRADRLFEKYELTNIKGDRVIFYPSGCFSLALLGSRADLRDKAEFDPTRERRRAMHKYVCELFPEYTVYLGGKTSLDAVPKGYSKYTALCEYCDAHGISHDEAVFCGDDYGSHGNDEPVYSSDFDFIKIDGHHTLIKRLKHLL